MLRLHDAQIGTRLSTVVGPPLHSGILCPQWKSICRINVSRQQGHKAWPTVGPNWESHTFRRITFEIVSFLVFGFFAARFAILFALRVLSITSTFFSLDSRGSIAFDAHRPIYKSHSKNESLQVRTWSGDVWLGHCNFRSCRHGAWLSTSVAQRRRCAHGNIAVSKRSCGPMSTV